MKHATIHIQDRTIPKGYDVFVGKGLLSRLQTLIAFNNYSSACIITDEHTTAFLDQVSNALWLKHSVITVPAGDTYKTVDTVQTIWKQMLDAHCDRKTLVVNLGGGVIGDMGGFAASTYMRGTDYVQIPTTLLAQVDASVGGKLGINFHGIKNSIGSFQQPVAVIIDVETLKTLPERQLISGFGEIIKHGLVADKEYFYTVTQKKPKDFTDDEMIAIITRSVEIKRNIIQSDLTEKGERKLVNFGHTIGHAIESLSLKSAHPLLHGEAVSIGMLAESRLSMAAGMLSQDDLQTIHDALANAGLPVRYHIEDKLAVLQKMQSDKKNIGGKILWTLLKHIGEGVYDQELPQEIIRKEVNNL